MDEEFTKCSICLENYDKNIRYPKQLQCQHAFCAPCLNQVMNGANSVTCPTCRMNFNVRFNDIPKSRLILNFLEMSGPSNSSSPPNTSQPSFSYPTQPSASYPTQPSASYPTQPSASYAPQSFASHPSQPPPRQPVAGSYSNQPYNDYSIYDPSNDYSSTQSYQTSNNQQQSQTDLLRASFIAMDINDDGYISFEELFQALKEGSPSPDFSRETVKLILNKYDSNHDNKISFEEFNNLFIGINNQFNEFLDIDVDFSGSIDMNELAEYFRAKGFRFSTNFFNFLISTIAQRTGTRDISFDIYLRLRARMDQLNAEYQRNRIRDDKEVYFGRNFFRSF